MSFLPEHNGTQLEDDSDDEDGCNVRADHSLTQIDYCNQISAPAAISVVNGLQKLTGVTTAGILDTKLLWHSGYICCRMLRLIRQLRNSPSVIFCHFFQL